MNNIISVPQTPPNEDLLQKVEGRFSTVLADPPWQFQNRTGKVAPEHRRLLRYPTMELQEIMDLPVGKLAAAKSHLYLWVPNALLMEGLQVMRAWGFAYKSNIVWFKVRKDGGPDGRGGGLLFSECDGAFAIRSQGEHADPQTGQNPGKHAGHAKT